MNIFDLVFSDQNCCVCGQRLKCYIVLETRYSSFILEVCSTEGQKNIKLCSPDNPNIYSYIDLEHHLMTLPENLLHIAPTGVYVLFVCNPRSIVYSDNARDFEINTYYSCYYKSSYTDKINSYTNDKGIFKIKSTDRSALIECENMCLKFTMQDNLEKVYNLSIDYLANTSSIFYYLFFPEQENNDDDYDPQVLEINLPSLMTFERYPIVNKDLIKKKLDSIILLS